MFCKIFRTKIRKIPQFLVRSRSRSPRTPLPRFLSAGADGAVFAVPALRVPPHRRVLIMRAFPVPHDHVPAMPFPGVPPFCRVPQTPLPQSGSVRAVPLASAGSAAFSRRHRTALSPPHRPREFHRSARPGRLLPAYRTSVISSIRYPAPPMRSMTSST